MRRSLHRRCVAGLRPGGRIVLEAYTPRQLELGTGGPPVAELMMDADSLLGEFTGLHIVLLQEAERSIREGEYHSGTGAVVQLVARKPQETDR